MVQTAKLADFSRAPFEVAGGQSAVAIGANSRSARILAVVGNSIWELLATASMLILAPLILLSLAAAFVVACFRMQYSDIAPEPHPAGAFAQESSPLPPDGNLRAQITRRSGSVGESRFLSPFAAEHLWN